MLCLVTDSITCINACIIYAFIRNIDNRNINSFIRMFIQIFCTLLAILNVCFNPEWAYIANFYYLLPLLLLLMCKNVTPTQKTLLLIVLNRFNTKYSLLTLFKKNFFEYDLTIVLFKGYLWVNGLKIYSNVTEKLIYIPG